jgi:hypothetical protein
METIFIASGVTIGATFGFIGLPGFFRDAFSMVADASVTVSLILLALITAGIAGQARRPATCTGRR